MPPSEYLQNISIFYKKKVQRKEIKIIEKSMKEKLRIILYDTRALTQKTDVNKKTIIF